MIEIIVINRIGDREFEGLFRKGQEDPIVAISRDGLKRLKICNGEIFTGEIDDIAKQIASYVPKDCAEAVIAVHSHDFADIARELRAHADGRPWVIKNYGTRDDNYVEVEAALLEKDVVKVFDLFAPDRILEWKLDLLHDCLAPEKEVEFPLQLKDYLPEWRAFVEKVQGVDPSEKGGTVPILKQVSDPLSEDYVGALTTLRDALLDD